MRRVWKIQEPDIEISRRLASEVKIPILLAQLLVNRGIFDSKSAQEFLYPGLSNLHPPFKMKGISVATDRIHKAIKKGEKIWIYGDYDVDGTTSVSLLLLCLQYLGADVNYYIPNRLDEGYGIKKDALSDLKNQGCSLIITVDCGIGAIEEVRMANETGMDIIVTDHHEPPDELPPAFVVLDPKIEGCEYPFDGLAGVGVAFKLAQALMGDEDGKNEEFLKEQLDLVALGTIADVVPLMGENRIIAKYGLEIMNKMERPGIRALCEVSDIKDGSVNSYAVSYRLGPRINAAGRIDTARNAVRLLTTDSYEEALEIAQVLTDANRERQSIEKATLDQAERLIRKFDPAKLNSLILAEEGWHPGVIGIVASRLQEKYYRPTILISLEGEVGRGSARSIPEFDIYEALTKCSHLLETFGGHKAAAGLSVAKKSIDNFRREFSQIVADSLSFDDMKPSVIIDAKPELADLSEEVVDQLSLLEPYGLGNPQPLIALSDLSLKGFPRTVGKNNAHLQMLLSDRQNWVRTIAFNMGEMEKHLYDSDIRIDVVCRPQIDEWNNARSVQLKIEDMIIYRADDSEISLSSTEVLDLSHLKIVDRRNIPDKKRYLHKLITQGEKTLMYVRDDMAVDQLQRILSAYSLKAQLGLIYRKTSDDEKTNVKLMLMQGGLDAIVSSVPFDDPVPGLKHLVFCHPVPTRYDFVRACAPATESSENVYIHLIFNNKDVDLLTKLLNSQYPDRDMLANIYRKLREMREDGDNKPILIDEIVKVFDIDEPKEATISNCVSILSEIELVEIHQTDGKISVLVLPTPEKRRDLNDSTLYMEGQKLKSEWAKFSSFILKKTADDLRKLLLEGILGVDQS